MSEENPKNCGWCKWFKLIAIGEGACLYDPPRTFPVNTNQGLAWATKYPNIPSKNDPCSKWERVEK